MAQRNTPTLDKPSKEQIRQAALARHAARKQEDRPAAPAAYLAPPGPTAPEPVVVPDPVEVPVPAPVVSEVVLPPAPVAVTPRDTFKTWLRGRDGVSACDTRMSRDVVRFGAELEDRLFMAFQAGFAEGRSA